MRLEADTGTDNTYVVHGPGFRRGTPARPLRKEVTIEVTNVEEPGTVTLSTLQPQVGRLNHGYPG